MQGYHQKIIESAIMAASGRDVTVIIIADEKTPTVVGVNSSRVSSGNVEAEIQEAVVRMAQSNAEINKKNRELSQKADTLLEKLSVREVAPEKLVPIYPMDHSKGFDAQSLVAIGIEFSKNLSIGHALYPNRECSYNHFLSYKYKIEQFLTQIKEGDAELIAIAPKSVLRYIFNNDNALSPDFQDFVASDMLTEHSCALFISFCKDDTKVFCLADYPEGIGACVIPVNFVMPWLEEEVKANTAKKIEISIEDQEPLIGRYINKTKEVAPSFNNEQNKYHLDHIVNTIGISVTNLKFPKEDHIENGGSIEAYFDNVTSYSSTSVLMEDIENNVCRLIVFSNSSIIDRIKAKEDVVLKESDAFLYLVNSTEDADLFMNEARHLGIPSTMVSLEDYINLICNG